MTVQAGVWALSDGYSGEDVQNHLVVRDQHGNTPRAVSDEHIEQAHELPGKLGIKHRL